MREHEIFSAAEKQDVCYILDLCYILDTSFSRKTAALNISDLPNFLVTDYNQTDFCCQIFPVGFLLTELYQLWQQSVNIGSMRNNMLNQLGKKKSTKSSYWPN